jgi:hypothetical protein
LVNGPDLARRITGNTFYAWNGEVLVLNVLGKPAAARDAIGPAFTGLLAKVGANVQFANGVTLGDVSINNPDGIYAPVGDDEKFIAFALYSEDGKPLAETGKAAISLMSTSFNTGFQMGKKAGEANKPPTGAKAGSLPVLTARVGATIASPALNGMRYTFRDWHLNDIGSGTITGGKLTIPADKPIFTIELTR